VSACIGNFSGGQPEAGSVILAVPTAGYQPFESSHACLLVKISPIYLGCLRTVCVRQYAAPIAPKIVFHDSEFVYEY